MKLVTPKEVQDYIDHLRQDFGTEVRKTRPWWLQAAYQMLFWLPKEKRSRFTTTIGNTIYLAPRWEEFGFKSRLRTLRHEERHLLQFKKMGLFFMGIVYLLLPLPIGLALGRALLEAAAMEEGIKARIEQDGIGPEVRQNLLAHYLETICGPGYCWAFPFKKLVEKRWFDPVWAAAVRSSHSSS